jgi:hypothetical protein
MSLSSTLSNMGKRPNVTVCFLDVIYLLVCVFSIAINVYVMTDQPSTSQ